MKKALSLFLTFAIVLSLFSTCSLAISYGEEYEGYTAAEEQSYSDVPSSHWASKAVETCSLRGWFSGYPDGTFQPAKTITREEAVKVFVVAMGLPTPAVTETSYTDVPANYWAAPYIEVGKYLLPDTVNASGGRSFRPAQTITREETIYALVLAWRYASKAQVSDQSVLNMFTDLSSVSQGLRPYVAVAVSEGLVSGLPDGSIGAQKGLTRAEFATLLYRALEHGYGQDDPSAPELRFDSIPTTTGQAAMTISGRVNAPVAVGLSVTCDGEAVTLDPGGSFQVEKRLSQGTNSFLFQATNIYGAVSGQTVTVTMDAAKPSIRWLSPVPGETSDEKISVNGKINEMKSGSLLMLNNQRCTVDGEGYFTLSLPLQPGENVFTLEVVENGATVTTETLRVTRLDTAGAGEWQESLPSFVDSAHYTIEQKSQYRVRTRSVCTDPADTKEGWTLIASGGAWGNWSEWSASPATASGTREVETRQNKVEDGKTQYRYYAYVGNLTAEGARLSGVTAGAGGQWRHFSSAWMERYTTSYWTDYTPWLDGPITREAGWHQVWGGQDGYKYRYNGQVYYNEETQQTQAAYETQYRYRDYAGANTFEQWSDWSGWQDGQGAEDENTRVETRTVYRYTVKP